MSRAYLAFTAKGEALAHRLAEALPGSVSRCGGDVTLKGWTAEHFAQDEALIFVGAVGIAVRAIAPHCRSKAADPAVVVVDEGGNFAVPLLSGHLGGANALARALAKRAARCRSSRRPPTSTASSPWTSGPRPRTALSLSRSASSGSAAPCWPGRLSGTGRRGRWRGDPAGVKKADAPEAADFALTSRRRAGRSTSSPHRGAGGGCRRARRPASWKKPLQRSVPRPASARRRSAQPPAST